MFLGRVWRSVVGSEQYLQQVAEGLDHTGLGYGRDLLEPVTEGLQTRGDVAFEEDCEVGLLRLNFAFINPTLYIPTIKDSVTQAGTG